MHAILVNQRAIVDGKPGFAWSKQHGKDGKYDCYLDEEFTTGGQLRHDLYFPSQVRLLFDEKTGAPIPALFVNKDGQHEFTVPPSRSWVSDGLGGGRWVERSQR